LGYTERSSAAIGVLNRITEYKTLYLYSILHESNRRESFEKRYLCSNIRLFG
jgi:hypothetical protein